MNTKSIYILFLVLGIASINVYSQSTNQNYILTRTYTNEVGTTYLEQVQYFDGLGRPMQMVQKAITPGTDPSVRKDLILLQEYDSFGREDKAWLPAAIGGNNGAYVTPATVKTQAIATNGGDQKPYSLPVYEASPLNRVLKQFSPGQDWHNNSKSVETAYQTNIAGDARLNCKLYLAGGDNQSPSLSQSGNYATGELYVTEMKDEDGNTSYEFKDKLGQVVLTRQMEGSTPYDTYYAYNVFGNLCFVLPPRIQDEGITQAKLDGLAYQYKYDHRNRCIAKKLPGCEWIYYVYDKADRLIFTQDGEQRAKQPTAEWTFNKYDAFGRLIVTGIYTTNQSQDALTSKCKDIVVTEKPGGYYEYTWNSLPEISYSGTLSLNYYDDYHTYFNSTLRETLKYVKKDGFPDRYINNSLGEATPKGLLIGTRIKTIGANGTISGEIASKMYYDDRGRVIQVKSTNHLGGIDEEHIAYNFTGQPIKRMLIHTKDAQGGGRQEELYTYSYDHAGRLLTTKHKLNTAAEVTLAENSYDELGRLKTKTSNNSNDLTGTYTYNVRSWLTRIREAKFIEDLAYTYGGNIKEMTWEQASQVRKYTYGYDNLSRLTSSVYTPVTTNITSEKYSTSYTYDKHGNMLTLQRYGKTTASAYGLVDNLTMTYTGNQLLTANDAVANISLAESADFKNYSNVATEYLYNRNGAMTADLNKGITDIQYNSLNLPRQMDIKSPVAEARNEYTYSAGGQKLKVVQKWNPNYSTTPVIGSAVNTAALTQTQTTDYVGNIVYENNILKRILVDGGYIEAGVYHFYVLDHLGNNRLTINSGNVIVQRNHYYPFGTAFADKYDDGKNQPYKYNGKELDQMHGLNLYDYSARYYESAIGRFTTVDPLAEKYYSISPYVYCNNNPIKYIDPTGMWIQHSDSTGSYRYNNGQWEQYQTSGVNAGQYTAYTPAAGSFMAGVLDGLNKLNNNVTGNGLLDFFANDDNNAFIVAGTENTADISNSALGTISLSSTFQGSPIATERGAQMSPFWLDIGHELSHRQDVLKNGATQAGTTWVTQPDGIVIKTSEKYATHMENLMRADAGLSLRTHYTTEYQGGVATGGWEPSRILNTGTRTSTFYGTTYRSFPRILIPKGILPSSR